MNPKTLRLSGLPHMLFLLFPLCLFLIFLLSGCDGIPKKGLVVTVTENPSGDCTWAFAGRLAVKDSIMLRGTLDDYEVYRGEALESDSLTFPLRNVKIEAMMKRGPGLPYGKVGETYTDENGGFRISVNRSCDRRQIRLFAVLNNDDLRVGRTIAENHRIRFLDTDWLEESTSFDNVTFNSTMVGADDFDLEAYRAVNVFWALDRLMRIMDEHDVPFQEKLLVNYSTAVVCSMGCAVPYEPIRMHIDWFEAWSPNHAKRQLIHEVMHPWHYSRLRGTINLANGSNPINTHQPREPIFWAFTEGLAEYAARELIAEFGQNYPVKPQSRTSLNAALPDPTWDALIHNDNGVMNFLQLLSWDDYSHYIFDSGTHLVADTVGKIYNGCPNPNFSVWEVLRGLDEDPSIGRPSRMHASEGLEEFLDLMVKKYTKRFPPDVRDHMIELMAGDFPAAERRAPAALCSSILVAAP